MRKTETEKAMRKEERYKGVLNWFKENVPVAETELHYDDPYQLLIAVILSAQCTDKRVNMITPALFEAFPTPEVMAASTPEVVFEYIRSVSYPNNKAKHLVGMAKMLIEDFKGVVPSDFDELQKLPGVGRKTANVIASVVYDKPAMAVDTHVFRVSNRIGLTNNSKTPLETEKELVKNIPEELKGYPMYSVPLRSYNLSNIENIRRMLSSDNIISGGDYKPLEGEKNLDDLVDDLYSSGKRVIFTMGKGGVGKTTVATNIALKLKTRGARGHLTTTDPANHLN